MNHMLIGLGGTGGRMICNFRKTICREYPDGGGEPVRKGADGRMGDPEVKLGYLYVDSDPDDLNNIDTWRVFGESVRLEESQKLLINKGSLGAALEGMARNPAVSRWIGNSKRLEKLLKDTGKTPGAGQIRRRGRFLFSNSVRDYNQLVAEEVKRLRAGSTTASVAFHVCCTLAAGTGSGSFIDALASLRRRFPDSVNHPIYLYLLVTDSDVGDVNTGNFYANQYAALMELNAYMLNDYHPHDVAGSGERIDDTKDRVQACYLITDVNRENSPSSREEQELMIAEYLYNRIVAFRGAINSQFSRSWTYQDVDRFRGDQRGLSYGFGSIGVKRWAIPEGEIREKLALTFAQSAGRQAVFNLWDREHGFRDKPGSSGDSVEVSIDSLQRWFLADDQALLNRDFEFDGQTGSTPSWDQEWANTVNFHLRQVQEERATDQNSWLRELEARANTHLERNFRDRGVANYYNERVEAVDDYARRSLDAIEKDLYKDWSKGTKGLHEIKRILEQLRTQLSRRAKAVDDQDIGDADRMITDGERFMRDAQREWAKVGWLNNVLMKTRDKQLGVFAARLRQHGYYRTLRQALLFKKALYEEVVKRVDVLVDAVGRISAQFSEVSRKAGEEASQRCTEGAELRFEDSLVREYNPRAIKDISRSLMLHENVQQTHATAVRGALERAMGPDPSLVNLDRYISRGALRELIEAQSFASSAAQHAQVVATGAEAVLNVSIVDKLREKYSGDPEGLRNDVERFMRMAATAFRIDNNQDQPGVVEGRGDMPTMPIRRMVVFLPGADVADPFVNELKDRFARAVAGVAVDVVSSDRTHEIAVLSADYWMAARFFSSLSTIKGHYAKKLQDAEEGELEIHIEDHVRPLTDLFIPLGAETAKAGSMLRFMGQQLGVLEECEMDGGRGVAYVEKATSGRRLAPPARIADNWEDFERLSLPELRRLEGRIRSCVETRMEAVPGFKRDMVAQIEKHLDEVFERCKQNNDHPDMLRAAADGDKAKRFLAEIEP